MVNYFKTLPKGWNHIKSITRSIIIRSHELQQSTQTITLHRDQKIVLPKPGKKDYNQPKSFITITLSNLASAFETPRTSYHLAHAT